MLKMSPPRLVTVMIVDDHPVVRDGLNSMLSMEPDLKVVGEAANGEEALRLIPSLRPNIVVMDLMLPDMSGSDVIGQICSQSSDILFIVLTSVAADEEIYRALEAGARGYLFKDMAGRELIQAIRAVHAGERYIPAPVGVRLAGSFPRHGLSAREIEILEHVAAGLRNKEIAYELGLSENTVNAHVKHILEKLHVSDRTHAVTTALKRGIIRL
jgi:two-component system NarL family response regulator